MGIESTNKKNNQNSFKFKTILFLTCAILSTLAEPLSFLGNERIEIQIFFIILLTFCIYFTFYFLKKRNGYTKEQGFLFWKISTIAIISLIIYILLKNFEEPVAEANKRTYNKIKNSFEKNKFRDLHIYNYIPQQEYSETPSSHTSLKESAPNIPIPVRKKAAQNTQPIHIEEDLKTPIMEVPKDAGDKKIIKPVLHFST